MEEISLGTILRHMSLNPPTNTSQLPLPPAPFPEGWNQDGERDPYDD